jgi:hypothetical protein
VKIEDVGEIIAERKFELLHDAHERETIVVHLGKPARVPNHTDFYCPDEIARPNSKKIMAICGLDAFQALQLAMAAIGVELEIIKRDSEGPLIWVGNKKGDLGFPTSD